MARPATARADGLAALLPQGCFSIPTKPGSIVFADAATPHRVLNQQPSLLRGTTEAGTAKVTIDALKQIPGTANG
jgi:hypothetical protein